ncbi:MAG: endolytic transglycosylase MltG [Candidatus Caldipriscus sp.]|nr:endolytic transglycosylase MltG [Candidatus Caldipriscus sp.]
MITLLLPILFFSCSREKGEEVFIVIKRGQSLSSILEEMREKGVIRYPTLLKALMKISGVERSIKPGKYMFFKGQGEIWVFLSLREGPKVSHFRLTIKEGENLRDIAKKLEDADLDPSRFLSLSKDSTFISKLAEMGFDFLMGKRSLEGFLYPETYFLDYGITEEEVFIEPLKKFKKVWDSLKVEENAKNVGLNPYEVLILASIVEKEAVVEEEKPLIASVFLNRLKKGMNLAADPTVKYILENPPKILSYSEIKVDNPYNTYRYPGLPPTPICSPTSSSISAVLYPAKTDYLFFSSRDGRYHYFSRSYSEHLRNVKKMKLR